MNQDKILGCLLGAAAADAMGAATEVRTRKQIEDYFGGYVTSFLTPPDDTFARGSERGQVTDDFSIAYVTCEEIIKNGGAITDETALAALLRWADIDKYFTRFAGPTTRASVARLKGTQAASPDEFVPVNENLQATNGAAMKSSPIALFSGGDVDKAIADAITVCKITHPNSSALSGAGAVAAATAAALKDNATVFDVVRAGIYGAREGERIGLLKTSPVAACSIEKKIKLAVAIGMTANDLSSAIDEIADIIGSGLAASEAVPAAFGLIVAANGDTVTAIEAAVNIGNDTDTVATMVGGILGALGGVKSMPETWLPFIERANGFELHAMAKKIKKLSA